MAKQNNNITSGADNQENFNENNLEQIHLQQKVDEEIVEVLYDSDMMVMQNEQLEQSMPSVSYFNFWSNQTIAFYDKNLWYAGSVERPNILNQTPFELQQNPAIEIPKDTPLLELFSHDQVDTTGAFDKSLSRKLTEEFSLWSIGEGEPVYIGFQKPDPRYAPVAEIDTDVSRFATSLPSQGKEYRETEELFNKLSEQGTFYLQYGRLLSKQQCQQLLFILAKQAAEWLGEPENPNYPTETTTIDHLKTLLYVGYNDDGGAIPRNHYFYDEQQQKFFQAKEEYGKWMIKECTHPYCSRVNTLYVAQYGISEIKRSFEEDCLPIVNGSDFCDASIDILEQHVDAIQQIQNISGASTQSIKYQITLRSESRFTTDFDKKAEEIIKALSL